MCVTFNSQIDRERKTHNVLPRFLACLLRTRRKQKQHVLIMQVCRLPSVFVLSFIVG